MTHLSMLWPGGREKALTFSYDDCVLQDIRLIGMMNKNGIRGTFNLNSGAFGDEDHLIREGKYVQHSHVRAEDVKAIYAGHEVAVHTVTHPNLCALPDAQVLDEVLTDRKNLEALVGYPVRGMAYPGGGVDGRVISLLKGCGIVYARAVGTTRKYRLPERPLDWECSCHHWNLEELIDPFLNGNGLMLLSVWGHAYEFDQRNDWDVIENQLSRLGGHEDVWYATNIEVFDYIDAFRSLDVSVEGSFARNRNHQSVWVKVRGREYEIPAGQTVYFE